MSQSRPKIYLSSYAKILQRALQYQIKSMPVSAQEIDNPDNEIITSLEYVQSKLEMHDLYLLGTTEVQKDLSLLISKVATYERERYLIAIAQLVNLVSIVYYVPQGITPVTLLFCVLVGMELIHNLMTEDSMLDPILKDEMRQVLGQQPVSISEHPLEFLQNTVTNAVSNSFNFVASNVLYFTRNRFNLNFFAAVAPQSIREQLRARLNPQDFSSSEDEDNTQALAPFGFDHV
jgi:hypothetical protein